MAVVKNDRDVLLQSATVRIVDTAANIGLSAGIFTTAKNGGATTPASITLTANTTGFSPSATKTWYWASNEAPDTWTNIGTGDTKTVTNSTFITNKGNGTSIQYKVVVTEFGYTDAYGFNTISYIKAADDAIAPNLIVPVDLPIANSSGVVSSLPTGNALRLYQGGTLLTSGVTYSGTATQNGLTLTINSSTGGITLSQTSWTSDSESFVLTATYNSIAYTITYTITKVKTGTTGSTGATGDKFITITAFQWSNSGAGAHTQAFTYTWSSGSVSAYPSGWTATAPASPGTGYTLYQLTLVVADVGSATSTNTNWSAANVNSIGYREDGSIGIQGDSHRTAYSLYNSGSLSFSGTTTSSGSTSVPSGVWTTGQLTAFTQTVQSPSTGQALYQSDGVYSTATGNITWQAPYLSNFKVGSLSAISADLGNITAGDITVGSSPAVSGTTMTGSGTHLYSDGKFCMGISTRNIGYNGTNLFINGLQVGAATTSLYTTIYDSTDISFYEEYGRTLTSFTPIKDHVIASCNGNYRIFINTVGSADKLINVITILRLYANGTQIGGGFGQTSDLTFTGGMSGAYSIPFALRLMATAPGYGQSIVAKLDFIINSTTAAYAASSVTQMYRIELKHCTILEELLT